LMVYMDDNCMYVDYAYECYLHCILIVYMGAIFMYVDCVYGC
jgi:hypothetical protein